MPVVAAADALDVRPEQVRRLVAARQLDAVKVGRELLVDVDSVRRRLVVRRPAPGRPLSPRMAWASLWFASGLRPGWVGATEASRARRYLDVGHPERWPRLLMRRSAVVRGRVLPSVSRAWADDPRFAVGGAAAAALHGADIVPDPDEREFYVLRPLSDAVAASVDAAADHPNVVVHVVDLDIPGLLGDVVPSAVAAADLLDAGDDRAAARVARDLLRDLGEGG